MGDAFVAGRNRVPSPAAGTTAFVTAMSRPYAAACPRSPSATGGTLGPVKPALRRRVLAARAALGDEVRAAGDDARDAVLAPLLVGARVAAYASFGTEPRTTGLVTPRTLLPVLLPDRDLDWAAGDGVPLGLHAVAQCDLVLVPALAVDRRGVRLGRGGGSYDRALVRARGLVVALLHEGELLEEPLPAEPHDVPVHAVATPSGLVRLR